MVKKIAVLTSGGDAPGMNACIRAITMRGESLGYEVYGIIGGYQGLIDGNFYKLGLKDVQNIINLGGTIIKTTRCNDFLTEEGFLKALNFVKNQNFTAIIILGGDGSLRGAKKLYEHGINVIGIPCTIDNDLAYTDFTIGFDTAVNTVTNLLNNIRETCSSHDRVCVTEVMGRYSGEIALNAGVSSGAEVILVPEINTTDIELYNKIKASTERGEKCVLVVVAEGVATAEDIAKKIKVNLNIDAKAVDFGYVQRGGSPTASDRIIATKFGGSAVELIDKKKFGVALAMSNLEVEPILLKKIFNFKRNLDKNLVNLNNIISI